ncbi:MAG TPA: HAD family phosphatase [Actinomycetota bacterium]|nr:HAD family phosphatase [Actinomycetota bacterium]
MNQPELKALIVDFGGVLTTPLQDSFAAFAEETGISLDDLVRAALPAYTGADDQLVTDFETGRISEEDFSKHFAARLTRATGLPVDPATLLGRLFAGARLEESMLDAVAAARRAGLKTGLLSNSWGLSGYPRERMADLFDDVVISGEAGLRKPDPAIFELAADRLGIAAEQCVFVDDHPGHLKAAQELGMTTVLHRAPETTIPELESLLGVTLSGSS